MAPTLTKAGWVLAAALLSAQATPASAVSGAELLRQCEVLERTATVRGETVRLPESRAAAQCWFYMAAVQDFAATVEEEGGMSLIGSCPSASTTRLDFIRAYLRYARAHREELGLRASALIVKALSDSFPCQAR